MARPAVVLIALLAAACSSPVTLPQIAARVIESVPAPKPPRVVAARFDCDGQTLLLASFDDHATLVGPGLEIVLQPKPSASGTLWDNGDISFWSTEAEAVFDFYGDATACRELPNPWKNASAGGIDFRAVGQEPGWFVEIDDERLIHLVYDYAERELTTGAPSKTLESDRTVFTGEAGDQLVTVAIQEKRCADVMSGEPYPYTVTVTVDDRELEGCGRLVVPGNGDRGSGIRDQGSPIPDP